MKYAHILQAFYGEPWYILPQTWQNFHELLQRAMQGQEIGTVRRDGAPLARRISGPPLSALQATHVSGDDCIVGPMDEKGNPVILQMYTVGSVAVIPVQGALGRKLTYLDLWCGGCDYDHISQFCQMACDDPNIQSVVLAIDSPGGMSAGCQECADDIRNLNACKPTVAYTEEVCCSAAYWLASQCSEIIAHPAAMVGNVGTIFCGVDTSKQWEMDGKKLECFASSPLKAMGVPGKPWSDQDRAFFEERMQQCDARIKAGVRAGRADITEPALDGRWYFAADSGGSGVIDATSRCLEEVIAAQMARG